MNEILTKALLAPGNLNRSELRMLLETQNPAELYQVAYELKCRYSGKKVSLRGLIEHGNYCTKDCFYCGIRKSNHDVKRYQLEMDDVVRMARWAYEQHYGSVVLQSGEIESEANTVYIETILRRIRDFAGDKLGITLCLGEQETDVYRRWREAGAHRYLLRIETSNKVLYSQLHPETHHYQRRVNCLFHLKKLGFQTGSGVMIGLPGQTTEDLVSDILFFQKQDLDMIGMGPYIPHHQTPLGSGMEITETFRQKQLRLALNMIAATRLYLHDVNIAATTALQALDERGREQGLQAGANVMMPNVTDTQYRTNYQLYENKPCLNENSAKCRNCLAWRVRSIGEEINWDERGDAPHFVRKETNDSE